jgi:hypothetical protein
MASLQLMSLTPTYEKMTEDARSALPGAPRVPYEPKEPRTPVLRARLAGLLRRAADRVDPCPTPTMG